MHTTLTATLGTVALALGATATAQTTPRPGLWEHQVTMRSGSGQMEAALAQMQQQLAQLPPEQRKQMEAMLGQRGLGFNPGAPTTARLCITPEQAARDDFAPAETGCTQTGKERSGNTVRFKFACTGESRSSGEGDYTFDGDKAYQGRMVVRGASGGKAETMDMQVRARWLGADCGSVKPLDGKDALAPPGAKAPGAAVPQPRAPRP